MPELLDTVKGGQLSAEQLYILSQINSGKTEFEICDIEKLLDFNINENIIDLDHIEWDGKEVAFILRSEKGGNAGAIAISNAEKHNKDVRAYSALTDDANITVEKFEFENGGENIIIEKINNSLYKKVVVYTIKSGNKTFIVEKSYYSKDNSESPTSDFSDIPDLILIHAEEGGVYYEIHMMLLKADTTDEELLEFGIKNK